MNTSLDGFVEGPAGEIDFGTIDEEYHTHVNASLGGMGALVYGRRMHEVLAPHWSTADKNPESEPYEVEFARIWQRTPKIVLSTTLDEERWNTRVIGENVVEEIAKLKREAGGDLALSGAQTAATLIEHGLVDDYMPYVHPVLLGGGTPFFPPSAGTLDLRLKDTRTFGSGVVMLHYESMDSERSAGLTS